MPFLRMMTIRLLREIISNKYALRLIVHYLIVCVLRPVQTHYTRTIQHSTLYDRHCIALLGKVFKRTIHGLYNHSTSMTKQRIVG